MNGSPSAEAVYFPLAFTREGVRRPVEVHRPPDEHGLRHVAVEVDVRLAGFIRARLARAAVLTAMVYGLAGAFAVSDAFWGPRSTRTRRPEPRSRVWAGLW